MDGTTTYLGQSGVTLDSGDLHFDRLHFAFGFLAGEEKEKEKKEEVEW